MLLQIFLRAQHHKGRTVVNQAGIGRSNKFAALQHLRHSVKQSLAHARSDAFVLNGTADWRNTILQQSLLARLRCKRMAAQYPTVHFFFSNAFALGSKLRTLQHYRFAVNSRHKLGYAVPVVACIIRVIGIIAASWLRRAAFKATGNNYISLAAINFGCSNSNAFQTAAALYVHRKGRHRNIYACRQSHQARNIAASTHTVAGNDIIRLAQLIFFHHLLKHLRTQHLRRDMTIHTVDYAYVAAQAT